MTCRHEFETVPAAIAGAAGAVSVCTWCGLRLEVRWELLPAGLDVQGCCWNADGTPGGPEDQQLLEREVRAMLRRVGGAPADVQVLGRLHPARPSRRRRRVTAGAGRQATSAQAKRR